MSCITMTAWYVQPVLLGPGVAWHICKLLAIALHTHFLATEFKDMGSVKKYHAFGM